MNKNSVSLDKLLIVGFSNAGIFPIVSANNLTCGEQV
jgi:hypothetical protein